MTALRRHWHLSHLVAPARCSPPVVFPLSSVSASACPVASPQSASGPGPCVRMCRHPNGIPGRTSPGAACEPWSPPPRRCQCSPVRTAVASAIGINRISGHRVAFMTDWRLFLSCNFGPAWGNAITHSPRHRRRYSVAQPIQSCAVAIPQTFTAAAWA